MTEEKDTEQLLSEFVTEVMLVVRQFQDKGIPSSVVARRLLDIAKDLPDNRKRGGYKAMRVPGV